MESSLTPKEVLVKELISSFAFDEQAWTMSLKGAIDSEMVSAVRVFYEMYRATPPGPIEKPTPTFYISSPGGDLFCTFGIVDLMRFYEVAYGIKTNITVFGPAFSGASLITICGTGERSIGENSYLMIHDIWGVADAAFTATSAQKKAEYIKRLQHRYFMLYVDHSKLNLQDLEGNIRDDAYYDSKECLELGLVDKII